MEVSIFPYRPGTAYGNIRWIPSSPAAAGVFPSSHPCAPGRLIDPAWPATMEFGRGIELMQFRAHGYYASCFPEGDGIAFKPLNNQDIEQTIRDVEHCFGWTVTNKEKYTNAKA